MRRLRIVTGLLFTLWVAAHLGGCGDEPTQRECLRDKECPAGQVCYNEVCRPARDCYADSDCPSGKTCDPEAGICRSAGFGHIGDSCSGSSGCQKGTCFGLPGDAAASFCTETCRTNRDCPKDYRCVVPTGGKGSMCFPLPTEKGERKPGQLCDRERGHRDCDVGLYCHPGTSSSQDSFCTGRCVDHGECPEHWSCRQDPTYRLKLCLPGSADGKLGQDCSRFGTDDCLPGLTCVPSDNAGYVCSQRCSTTPRDTCPTGFSCMPLSYSGKGLKYCLPGGSASKKKLGESCEQPGDCTSGLCADDADGNGYCTRTCSKKEDCPAKLGCLRHTSANKKTFCLPPGFKQPF